VRALEGSYVGSVEEAPATLVEVVVTAFIWGIWWVCLAVIGGLLFMALLGQSRIVRWLLFIFLLPLSFLAGGQLAESWVGKIIGGIYGIGVLVVVFLKAASKSDLYEGTGGKTSGGRSYSSTVTSGPSSSRSWSSSESDSSNEGGFSGGGGSFGGGGASGSW